MLRKLDILLLISASVSARERSQSELKAIAASKLSADSEVKAANGSTMPLSAGSLQLVADDAAYSIYESSEAEGFVVVAKSDLVENPVIGYSTQEFSATDIPDGLQWYLKEASLELQALENGNAHRAATRHNATFEPVENFVTTQWSQEYPFNKLTPSSCPSGCVATALAQCLNYCQWPQSVSFEGTCSVTTTSGKKQETKTETLTINSTYTWPYNDTYKSLGRYGDNIDELLRDCGYATYMQYAADGSGTMMFFVGKALIDIFSYPEESVKYATYNSFNDHSVWAQTVYDELMLRCPIMVGAADAEFGGHAFVLSGIDADGLVYVNWGWRGSGNGYYDMLLLNPVVGKDEYSFTQGMDMVYGIRPAALPADHCVGRIYSYSGRDYTLRLGTEEDDEGVTRQVLYADLPYGFVNFNATAFQGVFGLFAEDLTDGTSWVIEEELQDRDTVPSCSGYFGSSGTFAQFYFYYYIDGQKGLIPGHTYRIAFGSCDDREGVWHSIISNYGEAAYELYYTGDPATSTISQKKVSVPHVVATAIEDITMDGQTVNSKSSNSQWFDLNGRRVTQARNGLYIINGRKVLLK